MSIEKNRWLTVDCPTVDAYTPKFWLFFKNNLKGGENLRKEDVRLEKIKKEEERLLALFEGISEKQLDLSRGAILESARMKVELDELQEIISSSEGLIKINPKNFSQQKELPVSKLIVKVRANYLNYIAKLSNILGKDNDDDDGDELNSYE